MNNRNNGSDQVKPSFIRIDEFLKREKQQLDDFRKWWAQQRRNQDTYSYPSELPDFEWFKRYLAFCDYHYDAGEDSYQDDTYDDYEDYDRGSLHHDQDYDE